MSNDENKSVYRDFPTSDELKIRDKVIMIVYAVLPFLLIGIIDAVIEFTPLGGDPERYGFLMPESFLFSFLIFNSFVFLFVFIVRSVNYMQGYDVPDKDTVIKHYGKNCKEDVDFIIRDNNYQILGMFAVALLVVFIVLFLVQWSLGALWNWDPLAITIPVLVVAPFAGAYAIRKHNRKKKIEEKIIMKELKGKH